MEFFLLAQIVGIYFVAAFFPGPNLFLVVKNAALVSRRAGVFTGAGVVAANAIWIFAAISNFANLENPQILEILKNLGAIYLIFLGGKFFFATPKKLLPKNSRAEKFGNF